MPASSSAIEPPPNPFSVPSLLSHGEPSPNVVRVRVPQRLRRREPLGGVQRQQSAEEGLAAGAGRMAPRQRRQLAPHGVCARVGAEGEGQAPGGLQLGFAALESGTNKCATL